MEISVTNRGSIIKSDESTENLQLNRETKKATFYSFFVNNCAVATTLGTEPDTAELSRNFAFFRHEHANSVEFNGPKQFFPEATSLETCF
jgi:hypothetical protein